MNLKYRILWVEDDNDWVESEIEFIESYLKKYGFTLEYENPEKYEKYDFSEFDIIIVDYKLTDEEQGQDVIEKIRKQELYTEILFYSVDGEDTLRQLISEKQLDGVYCASKYSCREKLEGLIYTTIRKTQDLNNLRGLVMAETSELDEMIKEILELLAEKDKVEKDKINKRQNKLSKRYKENIVDLKKYLLPDEFQKLVKSRHFDASFSLKTLLRFATCGRNSLIQNDIKPYENKILLERNILAHNPEESSTSILMKIKKSDGNIVEYDEQKFIDIRKDIQEYKRIFQKIIDNLNA